MIPYPYKFVDFGGADLVEVNGTTISGLYQSILNAINNCGEVVLYNWYFASIPVAPSYCTIDILEGVIFINRDIEVHDDDTVWVRTLVVDPTLEPITIDSNGVYYATEGIDGFNPVTVAVPPPVLSQLVADENGIYLPPSGSVGFDSVTVDVPQSTVGISEDVFYYVSSISSRYSGGYEYKGYVYGTQFATNCGLVLLADASQGATNVSLSDSIENYSGVVLQGIYNKTRTSSYNTSILYLDPQLNVSYWAGMKDRNQSYTCNVVFDTAESAVLSGNKQVIIYGIP